jgi:molybdate/tungstate transport system substrate-binding protein
VSPRAASRGSRRTTRRALAPLLATALAPGLAGCAGATVAGGLTPGGAHSRGAVAVSYAGSLTNLIEATLAPAFRRASGYSLEGFGGGSGEDAQQIKARVRRLDVFVSASAQADRQLQGAGDGNWVSWYATFARTPLLLAYDPSGRFGRELARGTPWYDVIAQPGIRVGRTDPQLDPKGQLTVSALQEAAQRLRRPRLSSLLAAFSVFPETALIGRLQSGQLDAAFLYAVEARGARVPAVKLTPVTRAASYTVAILAGSPDRAGAEAFVRFLLARTSAPLLAAGGLEPLLPATIAGRAAAMPASLRGLVR